MKRFSAHGRERLEEIGSGLDALRDHPDFILSEDHGQVCDLVFAGGGAKGVAHLGALWALDRLGIRLKRVAGNSAGAITAAFVAAGYTSDELIDKLFNVDFMEFRDGSWDTRLPRLALMVAITTSYGMYDGNKLQAWMERMMVRKNANTFGRLPRGEVGMLSSLDKKDGDRLTVIASDITHAQGVVLPRDLASDLYGRHRPNSFPVSAAVRMSISVPFFFTPFKLHDSLIVDGAFASNLPLEIFDVEDASKVRWPTLGINLTSLPSPPNPTDDILHFGLAIFDTMRYGQSSLSFLNYPTRICRIIDAPTDEVRTLDFDLSDEQKERLFLNGANAVLETLSGINGKGIRSVFNFGRYMELRRRWSYPSDPGEPYLPENDGGEGGGGT